MRSNHPPLLFRISLAQGPDDHAQAHSDGQAQPNVIHGGADSEAQYNAKTHAAIGEVSWYERSFVARDLIYHIGVTFIEMSDDDRHTLREYLVAAKREVEAIEIDV